MGLFNKHNAFLDTPCLKCGKRGHNEKTCNGVEKTGDDVLDQLRKDHTTYCVSEVLRIRRNDSLPK
jgi:hypothetical protein